MRHALLLAALLIAACSATSDAAPTDTGPAATGTMANPIAYDAASIARGQAIYRGNCIDCHNLDGRAIDNDVAPGAANLTDPSSWTSDGSDSATFRAIKNGAGDAEQMPAFEFFISDEDIWYVVNYLRSIRTVP